MVLRVLPPTVDHPEPVYLYDDPTLHHIQLSGQYIDQKGISRIRMMRASPQDIDRLCRVPVLREESNRDYRNSWTGGGMNTFQRDLDLENMQRLTEWWSAPDTISPNSPLIWLPGHVPLVEVGDALVSTLDCSPQTFARQMCGCGRTADQYADFDETWWFDSCRACGVCWRPGLMIDGQHRTRGMAMAPTANPPHQFFVSVLSACNPNPTDLEQAARLFIEINAGAEPLNDLHQTFLASHFEILDYQNARRHAAYSVGVELNAVGGPYNDWTTDTGAYPRLGRITLMPGGATLDYLTAGRIRDLVLDHIMETEVTVPAMGGGEINLTPYNWSPNPANDVSSLRDDLAILLRAITNVWEGNTGPRTAPRWYTHRGQGGDLQESRYLRVLIQALPMIMARIDQQGLPRDLANIENELRAIGNIQFSGPWNNWITGDSGIARLHRVISMIYRTAPYATPPNHWNINHWFGDQHDPIEIVNVIASNSQIEFGTETVCSQDPGIQTPVSLLGLGTNLVTIRNLTQNEEVVSSDSVTNSYHINTVDFESLGMPRAATGDTLEISVSVSTPFNEHIVHSNRVTVTVP